MCALALSGVAALGALRPAFGVVCACSWWALLAKVSHPALPCHLGEGLMACASPLSTFSVFWPEPRLMRVASLCVVVTLAVLNIYSIYLFIYFWGSS